MHSAARTPKMITESKPMQQPTMTVPRKEQQQQQPPRKIIFTVGSPEKVNETKKDDWFEVFLKYCSFCKKKLKPGINIYMYGIGAFCSPKCRADQIALDEIDNEEFPKLSTNMTP